MNIYAKFQLHLPYGFWEKDFFKISFLNLAFLLPWQPIKIRDLDKIHMVGRGLLQKHVCRATEILKFKSVHSTDDVIGTCVIVTKTNDSSFSSKNVLEIDYFSNTL